MVGSVEKGKSHSGINCGSSSLKYDLIKMPHNQSGQVIAHGFR